MPPASRKRALRVVGEEPARERERRLLLRIGQVLGDDRVPVADARRRSRRRGRRGSGDGLELADDRRLGRIVEARERGGRRTSPIAALPVASSWITSPWPSVP